MHGTLLDSELLAQVYLLMTGGQTQLFESEQNTNAAVGAPAKIRRLRKDRPPLPVTIPTAEEAQAHQDFLDMMKQKDEQ